jgi:hypothetical protein
MIAAEIWGNVSGMWFGQLRDQSTGLPESQVFIATSRGSVIAEIRYWVPLTHLPFLDRVCPTDP